jgi:hypothetical protein
VRLAREKRAKLYIDLLAEAHAEHQWMLNEVTLREPAEIVALLDYEDDDPTGAV